MSLRNLGYFCCHLKNVSKVRLAKTSVPYNRLHLEVALGLYKGGFISGVQRGSTAGPDETYVEATPDNISSRRLWLDLKYRDNRPVINDISLISRPNRRISLSKEEIKALAAGFQVRIVKPEQPAETIFVKDRRTNDIVPLKEAAARNIEGLVLCRVK